VSTFSVTAERLTILAHPNADALELAQVGLYRAVVAKGVYRTSDFAFYIPEQAVLPGALIEELGLTGRLAGAAKNRVRAVRLRGELSQGIVCRPAALADVDAAEAAGSRADFAEALGVVKWVPPVPASMSGEATGAPDLIRWGDVENIKRFPGVFEPGEPVEATEKVHGTCCCVTYVPRTGELFVTSKGLGSRWLGLVDGERNLYWRAVRRFGLRDAAAALAWKRGADRVALFGEVYGAGVQDLHYGADAGRDTTVGFALFDAAVDCGGEVAYLRPSEFREAAEELFPEVPLVPVLYSGLYDYGRLNALATGRESVSGREAHLREGLVVRAVSGRHSEVLGGRAIAKFVSDDYLTRSGAATEYE
jgi:RNA ligase (TIGR02306 family)